MGHQVKLLPWHSTWVLVSDSCQKAAAEGPSVWVSAICVAGSWFLAPSSWLLPQVWPSHVH